MIKTKTIVIVLMISSIIDKKSPRQGCRPEHRATDLRGRTRMKRSSLSLGRLDLSSRYFLKRSKIDISQKVKFLSTRLNRESGDLCDTDCSQPTIRAQKYAAIRQTRGLTIVNPTAVLRSTRVEKRVPAPALFGASPISLDADDQGEWY
jgi:hypothetical protein